MLNSLSYSTQNWIKKKNYAASIMYLKMFLQNKEQNCLKQTNKPTYCVIYHYFFVLRLNYFNCAPNRWFQVKKTHNPATENFKTCKKHASMCEWMARTLHNHFNFSWRFNLTAGLVVHFQIETHLPGFLLVSLEKTNCQVDSEVSVLSWNSVPEWSNAKDTSLFLRIYSTNGTFYHSPTSQFYLHSCFPSTEQLCHLILSSRFTSLRA